MRNVVGPRIRELRRALRPRVTQEHLAARLQAMGLDLDQTTISKVERGSRPVLDVEVVAIARALGVSVGVLFEGTDDTALEAYGASRSRKSSDDSRATD